MTPPSPVFRVLHANADPGPWIEALRTFKVDLAQPLKTEGASIVVRTRLLGQEVVIKRRELRRLGDRLKSRLGLGRASRQWRGARWLAGHGFDTARPVVAALEHTGSTVREWLVLESLPGASVLRHLADGDLSISRQHELARSLGRQIAAIGEAGMYNGDHKPSNLIVVQGRPAIVDTVAIRRGRRPERMLHALAVEPIGEGVLPRRSLRARLIHELVLAERHLSGGADRAGKARRRAIWNAVADSLSRHGDPTPRTSLINPGPR